MVGGVHEVSFSYRSSQRLVLFAAWFLEMGISEMGLRGFEMLPQFNVTIR